MRYQRSLEIEQRLETVLKEIQSGKYSTPMLAKRLGVSIPTISRIVAALRERGHDIRAEHHGGGWRYVATSQTEFKAPQSRVKDNTLAGERSEHQ